MKVIRVPIAVCAIVAASAASAISPGPALSSVKPGSYKVESYHTQVGFSVLHFGFTRYSGLFSGATGSLRLDPTNLAASKLDVVIPVESITTTVPKLTDELKGDKWFDAAKYPQATFTSTKVTVAPDGDTLRLYYGAADTSIAMATGSIRAMLQRLENTPEGNKRFEDM